MDYATVYPSSSGKHVSLHSTASRPSASPLSSNSSVHNLLTSQPNPGLWDNFKCDGDGWWIQDSLFAGTLRMVSDGSYMRDRHVGACSCAFIFQCSKTGNTATCTWAELQHTSDNYRGKLLGAIGLLSVLNAILSDPASLAIIGKSETELVGTLWTDCKGVIRHGNNPKRKLKQT